MTSLASALELVMLMHDASDKPVALVLAGPDGAGKTTLWQRKLAGLMQLPLIGGERMLDAMLPAPRPEWARQAQATNGAADGAADWPAVARFAAQAAVAQAMARRIPLAWETSFAQWRQRPDGTYESSIDRIGEMRAAGYFVLMVYVGLASGVLAERRVSSRALHGGTDVAEERVMARYQRSLMAMRYALEVPDAAVLLDNSLDESRAFTLCRVQAQHRRLYDVRDQGRTAAAIRAWLEQVAPE